MRIVIDSESQKFKTTKRWFICVVVLVVMFIVTGIISKQTGWDSDFFEGYFSCIILGYATGERKL